MKAQNKEEKLAKAQEREKLQREIALREKAERMQVETYALEKVETIFCGTWLCPFWLFWLVRIHKCYLGEGGFESLVKDLISRVVSINGLYKKF